MAVSRLNEIKNPMKNGARVQQSRPKPKSAFAEFKQQQDKINHACDQIAKSTRDIKDLIERYSRATKSSEEDEISAELDNIVQRTGKVAKECKANIQRLNDDLKKNASSYPEGSNELASRKQGIKASATKFIKRVKDYQASQELFKVNMKETLTRRVKIIAPDKDDAEIDKIIDDGEAGKIFQQVILQGKGRLADTYRDVMDTHKVSNFVYIIHIRIYIYTKYNKKNTNDDFLDFPPMFTEEKNGLSTLIYSLMYYYYYYLILNLFIYLSIYIHRKKI